MYRSAKAKWIHTLVQQRDDEFAVFCSPIETGNWARRRDCEMRRVNSSAGAPAVIPKAVSVLLPDRRSSRWA